MTTHPALMIWLSPAFPVGAFAYSHGLEWAFEAGDVTDAAALRDWLDDILAHGAGRNDAILLALAHRDASDPERLRQWAELGRALASSSERRLETCMQGDAFLSAIAASWPCEAAARYRAAATGETPYPVAVGLAAAGHAIPLTDTLLAYLTSFLASLVSAAIRLGITGQTDGQKAIAALMPRVADIAAEAEASGVEDLGGCLFKSDLGAMLHETQYSRLFRS
ncbi:MAG: urease accessory protein UreF [Microvirga sp.]|nr:urease accessory protein UreF [Microvirga sp.]